MSCAGPALGNLLRGGQPDANALAQQRTGLAVERTRVAAERTLMARIRTSLSMVTFGFSIYKFFQYLRESEGARGSLAAHGPRHLGLTLTAHTFPIFSSQSRGWRKKI